MKCTNARNVAASTHPRLLNIAAARGEDFGSRAIALPSELIRPSGIIRPERRVAVSGMDAHVAST